MLFTAALYSDKLFKDVGTSLTFFSILFIVFFLIFAKKIVKQICGVTTVVGFASLIMLILSIAIRNIVEQINIVATASLVGSALAWYPMRVASEFFKLSKDDKGFLRADLTLKDVNRIIFGIAIPNDEE